MTSTYGIGFRSMECCKMGAGHGKLTHLTRLRLAGNPLVRFVKTISVPVSDKEKVYKK
jgi:hypothetical protein